jgi:hypothetical protein
MNTLKGLIRWLKGLIRWLWVERGWTAQQSACDVQQENPPAATIASSIRISSARDPDISEQQPAQTQQQSTQPRQQRPQQEQQPAPKVATAEQPTSITASPTRTNLLNRECYYLGNPDLLSRESKTLFVGARELSKQGLEKANEIAKQEVDKGNVIITSGAEGAELAVTFAVLGKGDLILVIPVGVNRWRDYLKDRIIRHIKNAQSRGITISFNVDELLKARLTQFEEALKRGQILIISLKDPDYYRNHNHQDQYPFTTADATEKDDLMVDLSLNKRMYFIEPENGPGTRRTLRYAQATQRGSEIFLISGGSVSSIEHKTEVIRRICEERGVDELVHFTNILNLENIIRYGLLSRKEIETKGIRYYFNDKKRLENMSHAICLSISFPNYKMLYKYMRSEKFLIISLDKSILWELICIFCPTNAAQKNISELLGTPDGRQILSEPQALKDMFSDKLCKIKSSYSNVSYVGVPERLLRDRQRVSGYIQRAELGIPPHYTTDPQAEVLCLESISPKYIRKIYVESQKIKSNLEQQFPNLHVSIEVKPEFFRRREDHTHW